MRQRWPRSIFDNTERPDDDGPPPRPPHAPRPPMPSGARIKEEAA